MQRVTTVSMLAMFGAALLGASPFPAEDKACCAELRVRSGWCDGCKHGFAFNVELKNKDLHALCVGEQVDAAKLTCDGCKKALAEDGACKDCKVWCYKGVAYRSQYASWLAKGEPMAPGTKFPCKACAKAWEVNGRCSEHDVGFMDQRKYVGKDDNGNAYIAKTMLNAAIANEAKCAGCAIAIMTDGTCEKCSVTYLRGTRTEKKQP